MIGRIRLTVSEVAFDVPKFDIENALNKERLSDEDYKRNLDWVNSYYAGRLQGAGGTPAGTETVLRPGQEDLDIASLQHNGVSDEQE